MADASPQGKLIEFKGASLAVMTAHVRETEAVRLADALHMMLGGMPDFFAGEPAVLDFAQLVSTPDRVDWTAIISLLRRYQVQPIGVRNLPDYLHDGARRANLAILGPEGISAERPIAPAQAPGPAASHLHPSRAPPPPQPAAAAATTPAAPPWSSNARCAPASRSMPKAAIWSCWPA
jgi:septum site-determining protein MinC